jgi:hypothetical protein
MKGIKTAIWAQAEVRRLGLLAIPVVVSRRGDADAGAVLIKVIRPGLGVYVLSQAQDGEGNAAWIKATGPQPVDETAADAYIRRSIERDYDLWVLEIEDLKGLYQPDDKVL